MLKLGRKPDDSKYTAEEAASISLEDVKKMIVAQVPDAFTKTAKKSAAKKSATKKAAPKEGCQEKNSAHAAIQPYPGRIPGIQLLHQLVIARPAKLSFEIFPAGTGALRRSSRRLRLYQP